MLVYIGMNMFMLLFAMGELYFECLAWELLCTLRQLHRGPRLGQLPNEARAPGAGQGTHIVGALGKGVLALKRRSDNEFSQ